MKALANWLVARPHNGVIALALCVALGMYPLLGSAVLVTLVLHQGPATAAVKAAIALALIVLIGWITQSANALIVALVVMIWAPVLALALAARQWRSITLAVQASVLVAVVALLFALGTGGAGSEMGEQLVITIARVAEEQGLRELSAALLEEDRGAVLASMYSVGMFALLMMMSGALFLGYTLVRAMSEDGLSPNYGRICDLNLGRVLAILTAISVGVGMLADINWLFAAGFVMSGAFLLQGLAIAIDIGDIRRVSLRPDQFGFPAFEPASVARDHGD